MGIRGILFAVAVELAAVTLGAGSAFAGGLTLGTATVPVSNARLAQIAEQEADQIAAIPDHLNAEGVRLSPAQTAQFGTLAEVLREDAQNPALRQNVEKALHGVTLEPLSAEAGSGGVAVLRGLGYAGTSVFSVLFAPFAFTDSFLTGLISGPGHPPLPSSVSAALSAGASYHFVFIGLSALGYQLSWASDAAAVTGGLGAIAIDTIVCADHAGDDPSLARYCDRNAKILDAIDGASGRTGERAGLGLRDFLGNLVRFFDQSAAHDESNAVPSEPPYSPPVPLQSLGTPPSLHDGDLVRKPADPEAVREDLEKIIGQGGLLPGSIQLGRITSPPTGGPDSGKNLVEIRCEGNDSPVVLDVHATPEEWSSTFYLGLRKLGFLFPHPRVQITPAYSSIREKCGRHFEWKPRFLYRGFHLHTEHPNEWMEGFLEGKTAIADAVVRWLARNEQNVLQVVLLRTVPEQQLAANFREPYALAGRFGILRGLDVSFNMAQQKSYRLIPPFHFHSSKTLIVQRLGQLENDFDFDYVSSELGSSEITSGSYTQALQNIESARQELESHGKRLFVKAHVASDEHDPKYGNFNFLVQYAAKTVGAQPHTVMLYGLDDPDAPVYGNVNLKYMDDFMQVQTHARPTWYFPETSYWCGLDIDVPLFLTDYLRARATDLNDIEKQGVNGVVTFTSGQELGYWLFDWTSALMVDSQIGSDPWAGLALLGEDRGVWRKIGDFQTHFMKGKRLLSILSSSNLVEELPQPFTSIVLARHTMAQLSVDPSALADEIGVLKDAISELPDVSGVKNEELRTLLEVTHARIRHAYWVRMALQDEQNRAGDLENAKELRLAAQAQMENLISRFDRYPDTSIYEWGANPTSYTFGYLWTARTLHYWAREEGMVRDNDYSPWYENIVDPLRFMF